MRAFGSDCITFSFSSDMYLTRMSFLRALALNQSVDDGGVGGGMNHDNLAVVGLLAGKRRGMLRIAPALRQAAQRFVGQYQERVISVFRFVFSHCCALADRAALRAVNLAFVAIQRFGPRVLAYHPIRERDLRALAGD